jgi:hypothetical protein
MNADMLPSLLPFVIWSIIALIPALSLSRRVGKTRWWVVLALVPPFLGPIIFLYVIAYSRWTVTPMSNLLVRQEELTSRP